jgi:valyl-tRNA synthetase
LHAHCGDIEDVIHVSKPKKKCSCGSNEFRPEEDVFDTWMTSSMSPQCACKWLDKPDVYKKIYPMSLRPQSHDIIRTWAFYTILKSYLHFNSIPWTDIALGTYVLDPKGKGMHKSKGNVVWTHELLDKYGVDVVRYWVGTAKWGDDLPFQEKDCVAGQRFLIKLWNASRFCFMHLADYDGKKPKHLELVDRWLLSKLTTVIKTATEKFEEYDSSESKKAAEIFFWRDFCDNYLELVKDRIYNESRGKESKHAAQYTLYTALLAIIKILAPIMPHITEELYNAYFIKHEGTKSIHISEWPKADEKNIDEEAEKIGDAAVEIVSAVRKYKSENNKSLKVEIPRLKIETAVDLTEVLADIKSITRALEVTVNEGKETKIEIL